MTEEAWQIIEFMREDACCSCIFNSYLGECVSIVGCMNKKAADLIESLSAQLDQVTRERDAAVEELSYTRKCSICKNHLSEGGDCYGNHKCGNGNPDWQWRGVEKGAEG